MLPIPMGAPHPSRCCPSQWMLPVQMSVLHPNGCCLPCYALPLQMGSGPLQCDGCPSMHLMVTSPMSSKPS